MSLGFGNNKDDPIVEIFNGEPTEDSDIQIINRDGVANIDNDFGNNELNTPSGNTGQLYNDIEYGIQQPTAQYSNGSMQTFKDDSMGYNHLVGPANEFGETNAHNQLATLNQPKFSTPLPSMPLLSESAIPNGLSIQPMSLQGNVSLSDTANGGRPNILKKKKENTGPKTRPQFVMKMWSMVNDPKNYEFIHWNEDGKTIQVFQREEFMKVILPKYFKHSNFTSFVRQLNMYGWHKVQDITSGTLNQGKDDKNTNEIWKFENPYFIKDREDLLDKIVRNKSVSQESNANESNQNNFSLLLSELDQIKRNQLAIGEDLRRVRKDNKTLWQENYLTRERHQQQANTLDKILKFLAAVYGNNAGKMLEVDNQSFDINDLSHNNQMTAYNFQNQKQNVQSQPQQSSNIYNQQASSPYFKPRLMLMNKAHEKSPTSTSSIKNLRSEEHRDSTSTNGGTIEEIIRSYENTPSNVNNISNGSTYGGNDFNESTNNNVNRIYQQIINQDAPISSPRHFFPELHTNGASPYPDPGTPGFNLSRIATPVDPNSNDLMNGLEQNIYRQGQSIQQVQDWIQKLANQQQQQQQQLQHQQATINEINEDLKPEMTEFDVNEFLNNSNPNTSHPVVVTPGSSASTPNSKRNADQTDEQSNLKKKKRPNQ